MTVFSSSLNKLMIMLLFKNLCLLLGRYSLYYFMSSPHCVPFTGLPSVRRILVVGCSGHNGVNDHHSSHSYTEDNAALHARYVSGSKRTFPKSTIEPWVQSTPRRIEIGRFTDEGCRSPKFTAGKRKKSESQVPKRHETNATNIFHQVVKLLVAEASARNEIEADYVLTLSFLLPEMQSDPNKQCHREIYQSYQKQQLPHNSINTVDPYSAAVRDEFRIDDKSSVCIDDIEHIIAEVEKLEATSTKRQSETGSGSSATPEEVSREELHHYIAGGSLTDVYPPRTQSCVGLSNGRQYLDGENTALRRKYYGDNISNYLYYPLARCPPSPSIKLPTERFQTPPSINFCHGNTTTAQAANERFKKRLAAFYKHYGLAQSLIFVDVVVRCNAHRAEETMAALVGKYGPEPSCGNFHPSSTTSKQRFQSPKSGSISIGYCKMAHTDSHRPIMSRAKSNDSDSVFLSAPDS